MAKGKGEFDDYIEQDLRRGDRSRSEREPTRTCGTCNGQKTVVKSTSKFNSKGKFETHSERVTCGVCGGRGVR